MSILKLALLSPILTAAHMVYHRQIRIPDKGSISEPMAGITYRALCNPQPYTPHRHIQTKQGLTGPYLGMWGCGWGWCWAISIPKLLSYQFQVPQNEDHKILDATQHDEQNLGKSRWRPEMLRHATEMLCQPWWLLQNLFCQRVQACFEPWADAPIQAAAIAKQLFLLQLSSALPHCQMAQQSYTK